MLFSRSSLGAAWGTSMGRPSMMIVSLRAAIKQRISQDLRPDDFELPKPPTLEEQLERRRSELRNGLTDRQRLFLFGKLSGLNDKDAALAAGYSVSVAENEAKPPHAAFRSLRMIWPWMRHRLRRPR